MTKNKENTEFSDDSTHTTVISTGFPELDGMINGLNITDLILLSGRPGMGKTSMALNIASHVALQHRKTVALFSLEMSRSQLKRKLLSAGASVSMDKGFSSAGGGYEYSFP